MKSRTIAGALVAVLAAAAFVLPATPAFAAGTGDLIVQAVTPAHVPLAVQNLNIQVYVGIIDTGGNTDASGQLHFTGVQASSKIKVEFFPDSGSGYLASTVTGVKLSGGQTKHVTITVAKGGTVSGNVTAGSIATGLSGADVALVTSKGYVTYYGTTDSSGSYSIVGIPAGSYRVQFNSRIQHSNTFAAETYAWSYWRGTGKADTSSWTSAKTLTVKQQSSHASASAITGLNGTVSAPGVFHGTVTYWLSDTAAHAGQHVQFIGKYPADDFETTLDSGDTFATPINPGKYKVAIRGDYDSILATYPYYWYVSDSKGPATSESKGSWVTVNGASTSITFIPKPGASA